VAASAGTAHIPEDEEHNLGPTARVARQVIPRPTSSVEGEPAPWAHLPAELVRSIDVARVRRAVESRQEDAGRRNREEWLSITRLPEPSAPAAVLVPVFEEGGEARVVLTRRAAHLRTHTGEVSFPGGRLDAGETPEEAALREAAEEVGMDRAIVELVGHLSPLSTFSSGTTITPVVGVLPARPALTPNPNEVEHVFDVTLAQLVAPGIFHEERWSVPARAEDAFPVWFFELEEDTIWGATARVLVELLRLVLEV